MHTNNGKWSQPNVPHRGWTCVNIDDLGEPSKTCEMCENIEIRYVHYMEHPDYPEILGVGCVCAEHMENDYVNPRIREKRLRSVASRRLSWKKRKWKKSVDGVVYVNVDGFTIYVIKESNECAMCWSINVTHRLRGKTIFGRKLFKSEDEAKVFAFEALIWARDNQKKFFQNS